MRPIPMTICVHTNAIKKQDYGDISILGETMEEPLMRCALCNTQPEFYYDNQTQVFYIQHECKEKVYIGETTYKQLCYRWNQERGKHYGKN